MRGKWLGFFFSLAVSGAATAEGPTPPVPAAPQATAIGSAEIMAEIQRNNSGALADSVLRVLPIESKYNVGVSVVRRSQVDGKAPPDATVHEAITEVYQIIEGRGVLVTGGKLEAPVPFPSDGPIVRQMIGPSSSGKLILGGTRHSVGPGDIVVIPPHTAHGFVEINTDRIVYTLIRIDPQQLLELHGQANAQAATAPPESTNITEVWRQEDNYWRFVKAGDVDGYVALWHDKFIGWPCGQEHPKRKASIGDWVREVRDKHINVKVDLTREGAEDFGNIVVVHYRFTRVDTYPDGRTEGAGKESKITHTWMKVGDTWLIIGGMCGTLPDSAK